MLIAGALVFNYVVTVENIPRTLAALFKAYDLSPLGFLLLANIILLVLGCFLEGTTILLVIVPVMLPTAMALGVDPVHFGVIVVMNLMVGLLTPPFGMGLFVVAKIGNIPFEVLAREILPFIPLMILVLAICTYFPWLVMYFPNLLLD